MKPGIFAVLIVILFLSVHTQAQSFSINTTGATAHSSAMLDVSSTSKGLLIPRMTKAQKNAIASPATGLLVFQAAPDSVGFHYYNGAIWVWMDPLVGSAWKLTGNAGTDTANNFLGTIDNMPLAFRVNNENSGRIESNIATANTFLGFRSGRFTTGTFNTGLGNRALASNTTGTSNVALGAFTLGSHQTGSDNIAVGQNAMLSSTSSSSNVAIGTDALRTATTAVGLIAIGHNALYDNSTGFSNLAVGYEALRSNTTGSNNIAMGFQSLRTTTNGIVNIGIGYQSLFSTTSGGYNTAIGMEALRANTTGNFNIAIGGWQNMYRNTTGGGNISIGAEWPNASLYNNTTGARNISIGSNLFNNTTGSNNIAMGYLALNNSQTKDGNIAIGSGALLNNGVNAANVLFGVNNLALGNNALQGNKRGSANVAMGTNAAFTDSAQYYNVAIGYYAQALSQGDRNIGIGASALMNNNGSNNVAIGDSAGANLQVSGMVAVGNQALKSNTTGLNMVAVGDSALLANTTGNNNLAFGPQTLAANTTGSSNIAIGSYALNENLTGFANIAIGDSALKNNTSNWNIAIGRYAMNDVTTGDKNLAIGDVSLGNLTTGGSNVSIGYASQVASTTGRNNVSLGFRTGTSMQGYSNTILGGDAMGKPAVSYTVNNVVAVGDSTLFDIATGGSNNTGVGSKALRSTTSGYSNVAVGVRAMNDNTTGHNSVAVGDSAAFNSNASDIVAVGSKALYNSSVGLLSTAVGSHALYSNVSGDNNTALGYEAGYLNTGDGNVFLGYQAGRSETGSNKLYIDNSNTTTPLLYGDFSTNLLRINGTLNINNDYSFPIADGTPNQYLRTDGAGNVTWATVTGENTAANNGLTLSGSTVQMGGPLVSNTTVTHANFNFTHSLSGTGNFQIITPTLNAMTILPTGNTGIGTTSPQYKLHIVNTNAVTGAFGNGIFVQNTDAVTTGEATIAFKNSGPTGLPANRAWITGMNTFDNYVISYGDALTATNAIIRVDTSGTVGINPAGPPNTRLDINGDLAMRQNIITLVNGNNNNIAPGLYSFIKVTGPTAAFTITGLSGGVDGKIVTILNLTGQDMTIGHQNAGSLVGNRINCLTAGADYTTTGNGSVTLQYSLADSRWMVIATRD